MSKQYYVNMMGKWCERNCTITRFFQKIKDGEILVEELDDDIIAFKITDENLELLTKFVEDMNSAKLHRPRFLKNIESSPDLIRTPLNELGDKGEWVSWPKDWPAYYNASNEPCDVLVGPCCCGAWHQKGEFEFKKERFWDTSTDDLYDYVLYRNGEVVVKIPDYNYEPHQD